MRFKEFIQEGSDPNALNFEGGQFFVTPKVYRGNTTKVNKIEKTKWYAKFSIGVKDVGSDETVADSIGHELKDPSIKLGISKEEFKDIIEDAQDLEFYVAAYIFLMQYRYDVSPDTSTEEISVKMSGSSLLPILYRNSKHYYVDPFGKIKPIAFGETLDLEKIMKGINT